MHMSLISCLTMQIGIKKYSTTCVFQYFCSHVPIVCKITYAEHTHKWHVSRLYWISALPHVFYGEFSNEHFKSRCIKKHFCSDVPEYKIISGILNILALSFGASLFSVRYDRLQPFSKTDGVCLHFRQNKQFPKSMCRSMCNHFSIGNNIKVACT